MTDDGQRSQVSLSLAALVKVDSICDRYEDTWQAGERPDIAYYLNELTGQNQADLFRVLLRLDCRYRRKLGESPDADAYLERFPQYSALIRSVFSHGSNGSSNGSSNGQKRTVVETPTFVECHECGSRVKFDRPDLRETECGECGTRVPINRPRRKRETTRIPKTIGRYEIRQRLGGGQFGHVYRAYDPDLRCEVAIKIPRYEEFRTDKERRLFLDEARATFELVHPNIVRAHLLDWHGKVPYIVSDYIDGSTLEDLIERHELTTEQVIFIATKIADALHYAHNHFAEIIHRDVKPSNILVDHYGDPYLSDFGLAYRDEGDEHERSKNRTACGTPLYMSPEQWGGETLDGRSDVFSLGVVLFEMLTREHPFPGDTSVSKDERLEEVKRAIQNDPPGSELEAAQIHPHLQWICLKCLHKDRESRYATAEELAGDLGRFVERRPPRDFRWSIADYWWHFYKWCQDNRLATFSVVLTLFLAAALLTNAEVARRIEYWQQIHREQEEQINEQIFFRIKSIDDQVGLPEIADDPDEIGAGLEALVEVPVEDPRAKLYPRCRGFVLHHGLKSRKDSIRSQAADVLGEFGAVVARDEIVLKELKNLAAHDPEPKVSQAAAEAIGKIEGE